MVLSTPAATFRDKILGISIENMGVEHLRDLFMRNMRISWDIAVMKKNNHKGDASGGIMVDLYIYV